MAKINDEAFNRASESANLKQVQSENQEILTVAKTTVYAIPAAWINILTKNKISVSGYLKQSMFEKLKRDNLI